MDVAFALELAAFIENSDKTSKRPQFDMTVYAKGSRTAENQVRDGGEPNYCGTAGCIAGSAVFLRDRKLFVRALIDFNEYYKISGSAQHILKITSMQADILFAPEDDVDIRRIKAEHAVAMLRWLAEDPDKRCRVQSIRRKWRELLYTQAELKAALESMSSIYKPEMLRRD